MASADKARSPVRELPAAYFQRYLVGALVIGAACILVSARLRATDGDELVVDLLRDIGIGFVVSVLVVGFIEWRAGLTLRKDIATDVLEAVYKRIVPGVIYSQVRDSIFRSDVLRRGWELAIKVLPAAENTEDYVNARRSAVSEEVFLIEAEITYDLENLNDRDITYVVSHGIDLDVPVKAIGIPRFTEIEIGAQRWDVPRPKATTLVAEAKPYKPEGITFTISHERQVRFSAQVVLPGGDKVRVRYKLLRAIRAPGVYVQASSVPADGITITIESIPELRFDVLPLHSQSATLRELERGRKWEFPCGILPWQGFQVISSPARPAAETLDDYSGNRGA